MTRLDRGMSHATPSADVLAGRYGNRFLTEEVPKPEFPAGGMRRVDAMRLVGEELALDGDPQHNLATFVTTWMEPEAQRIIAENLHRNFIDHAEYPRTAEIEQRCIRMLADLFHAPGETTGARTQGSSEAIMLGALSLKWNWRKRREAAGKPTDRPNLVFGGDVHVVWEKFCRYFDVEPRIVPLAGAQVHDRPRGRGAARGREHDRRGRRAGHHVHGPHGRHRGHQHAARRASRRATGSTCRCTSTRPAAASSGRSSTRTREWDFRLSHVRSINVSGHKYGLVYPGIGWLIFRERDRPERGPRLLRELPRQDRRHVHPQLLHRLRDGAGPVLQPRPLRARGLHVHHGGDAEERARARRAARGERRTSS